MLKKILIVILVLGLVGVGVGVYVWFKPHKKVENAKGISVDATVLAKEYGDNETEANKKYLNRAVQVSGTVGDVGKNQDGGVVITLDTGDPMNGIMCTMREKDATASQGQKVVIKGFCSGYNLGVSLTDCILK